MEAIFAMNRDREVIEASGFWCEACLVGKSASDQSPDQRYCQGCYEFLLKEAEILAGHAKKDWIPRKPTATRGKTIAKTTADKVPSIPQDAGGIMSTVEHKKSEVDIIQPVTPVTIGKRGPKFTELPEDLIKQLAGEGMGNKTIATRLRVKGYSVSYKTIQRRLQGVML